MSLIELMAKHPALFYRQAWYADESFMRVLPNERYVRSPSHIVGIGKVPGSSRGLPLAVDLVAAYVRDPLNPIWDGYLWARDVDALGQRVYVGGLAFGKGLQIHRHLHITDNWGCPRWV